MYRMTRDAWGSASMSGYAVVTVLIGIVWYSGQPKESKDGEPECGRRRQSFRDWTNGRMRVESNPSLGSMVFVFQPRGPTLPCFLPPTSVIRLLVLFPPPSPPPAQRTRRWQNVPQDMRRVVLLFVNSPRCPMPARTQSQRRRTRLGYATAVVLSFRNHVSYMHLSPSLES